MFKKNCKNLFVLAFFFSINYLFAQNDEIMVKAYTLLSLAQENERQAMDALDAVKTKRIEIEEDLVDALENPMSLTKNDKRALEDELKITRKKEKEALKQTENAREFVAQISELITTGSPKKRQSFINKYEKEVKKIEVTKNENTNDEAITSTEVKTDDENKLPVDSPFSDNNEPKQSKKQDQLNKTAKTKKTEIPSDEIKRYNLKDDVMFNPPTSNCNLAFDGVDNFTKKKKKETQKMVFFRHTDDFMRSALKDKDYITCEAMATLVEGGFYFLNLIFTIESKDAQRAFGFIDKSSPISFKLMNGRNIILTTSKTDIGIADNLKGTTTYRALLQLGPSEVKSFLESEMDIVRVAWSAGYEDYEIYDVDFMQNLFKCLDKITK
jgi:hypothetical protein